MEKCRGRNREVMVFRGGVCPSRELLLCPKERCYRLVDGSPVTELHAVWNEETQPDVLGKASFVVGTCNAERRQSSALKAIKQHLSREVVIDGRFEKFFL